MRTELEKTAFVGEGLMAAKGTLGLGYGIGRSIGRHVSKMKPGKVKSVLQAIGRPIHRTSLDVTGVAMRRGMKGKPLLGKSERLSKHLETASKFVEPGITESAQTAHEIGRILGRKGTPVAQEVARHAAKGGPALAAVIGGAKSGKRWEEVVKAIPRPIQLAMHAPLKVKEMGPVGKTIETMTAPMSALRKAESKPIAAIGQVAHKTRQILRRAGRALKKQFLTTESGAPVRKLKRSNA